MNEETKRINLEEGYITEEDYPVTVKGISSTLGNVIEIETGRGCQISFFQEDSLRDLLGLRPPVIKIGLNLSDRLVDILSSDNVFLKTDIAEGMIFKKKSWNKKYFHKGCRSWVWVHWKTQRWFWMVYDGK